MEILIVVLIAALCFGAGYVYGVGLRAEIQKLRQHIADFLDALKAKL